LTDFLEPEVLRLVFAAMAEGVVLQDAEGKIYACNPSAERILGLTRDQMLGRSSIDARWRSIYEDGTPFPGEDHPAMISLRTGQPCNGVTMGIQKPKGELTWVLINSQPLFKPGQKKPHSVMASFVEITDRIQGQRTLREVEQLFSKAFRESPEGISISTLAEGRYIEVNDAFLRLLGFERREVIGKTALELGVWVDPKERIEFVEHLRTGLGIQKREMTFRAKSGRILEVEVSADVVKLDNELCLLGISRDITERDMLEQQLRQAQKMEAIGNLAGGVAHDFNNLLGVILGYSELMLERLDPLDSLRKFIEEIKKASNAGASLTRQLLAFSRRQVVQPVMMDLNEAITNVETMLRRLIGEHIELLTVLDGELEKVVADPGQIEQIIMNLAVNARDAMPDGGTLAIETRNAVIDQAFAEHHLGAQPGPYVQISVRDTGMGMDETVQAHMFEPFFTTKGPGKGTGLGLATVYGIVNQNRGYIEVASQPGMGTSVAIYLPRAEVGARIVAPEVHAVGPLYGSETVLLVEDAKELREIGRTFMEHAGYEVLEASNGEAALGVARQHSGPIHLLLTDVMMPGINGKALGEQLVLTRPAMRILYTSGYTDDVILQHGVLDPGVAFLPKPYTRVSLLQKVREVLDSHSGVAKASAAGSGDSEPSR
jgi:PAS domain S-box-containing protein